MRDDLSRSVIIFTFIKDFDLIYDNIHIWDIPRQIGRFEKF